MCPAICGPRTSATSRRTCSARFRAPRSTWSRSVRPWTAPGASRRNTTSCRSSSRSRCSTRSARARPSPPPTARWPRSRSSKERVGSRSIRSRFWRRRTASRSDPMKLLEPFDILNLVDYEKVRDARRREVVELKKARRVSVGRYLTFVFENRATVWFQIQEMVRAERIVDDAKIAEEVDVYNALLPRPGELAATMMIEIDEAAEIKPVLDKLLGIDARDYVKMTVGPRTIVGDFEAGHSDEERRTLSAVHFVRFTLPPGARRLFREAEVALAVEHPNERARAVLSVETKRALLQDLPLQDPS